MDLNPTSIPGYQSSRDDLLAWTSQVHPAACATLLMMEMAALPAFEEDRPADPGSVRDHLVEAVARGKDVVEGRLTVMLNDHDGEDAYTALRAALGEGGDPEAITVALLGMDQLTRMNFQLEMIALCEGILAPFLSEPQVLAEFAEYRNGGAVEPEPEAEPQAEVEVEVEVEHFYNQCLAFQPQYDAYNRDALDRVQEGRSLTYWQWGDVVLIGRSTDTKPLRDYLDRLIAGEAAGRRPARTGQVRMEARGRGLDRGRVSVHGSKPALSVFDHELENALKRITKKKIKVEGHKELQDS